MKGFAKNIKYIARKITASRVSAYAAQTAFFMFMSLIPLTMLLFSLLGNIWTTDDALGIISNGYMPDIVNSFVNTYFNYFSNIYCTCPL